MSTFSRGWEMNPRSPCFEGARPRGLPFRARCSLLRAASSHAPYKPSVRATAPTFGGVPGLASEGRSESSVSSRAQAISWERCMVPTRWRGAESAAGTAGEQPDRQARSRPARRTRALLLRGAGWVRSESVARLVPF